MPSRSRVRYRAKSYPVTRNRKVFDSNNNLYSDDTDSIEIFDAFEFTSDVVGSGERVHPCTHNTVRVTNRSRPTIVGPTGWTEVPSSFYEPIPSGIAERAIDESVLIDMGALSDWAFDRLYPQVPQEVSIPNFLYELRELAALVPQVGSNLTSTVSGGYLNYQFGWKPFIGDIQAILGLMQTVRARLEYLKSTWGRETRISCQRELDVEQLTDFEDSGYYVSTDIRSVFRCSGYLYHELQDLDGYIGEFRALMGATGFNNPLGVLWEAIPYSFVADWFGRAGALISRTPIQPFVGPWEIRGLTHSVRSAGKLTVDAIHPLPGHSPARWRVWDVSVVFYTRDVGLPASSSLLYEDGLSSQQQTLAAALIGGRHK